MLSFIYNGTYDEAGTIASFVDDSIQWYGDNDVDFPMTELQIENDHGCIMTVSHEGVRQIVRAVEAGLAESKQEAISEVEYTVGVSFDYYSGQMG